MSIDRIGHDASHRVSRRSLLGGSLALAANAALGSPLQVQIGQGRGATLFDLLRQPADCVPFTPEISWPHTESWLRAVAASGSVLLVSPHPKAIGPNQKAAIRSAFALAATQPHSEPMDWMQVATPSRWQISSKVESFAWLDAAGAWPFPA